MGCPHGGSGCCVAAVRERERGREEKEGRGAENRGQKEEEGEVVLIDHLGSLPWFLLFCYGFLTSFCSGFFTSFCSWVPILILLNCMNIVYVMG